jgi:hypothetical protein
MKRAAEGLDDNSTKKARLDNSQDPFGEGLERFANDICRDGADDTGFISGKVFMVWRGTTKIRLNVQSTDSSATALFRFDVELTGAFVSEYFEALKFQSSDAFQIALRGAKVEKMNDSSGPNSLPMKLKYEDAIVIKWIKRSQNSDDNDTILDIWKRKF